MPTTIYDSSQITKRRAQKAISGSFINRIQNPINPTTGYAPILGISDQSIINYVTTGQMTIYRKNEGGCMIINTGCPCSELNTNLINGSIDSGLPGPVQNLNVTIGSVIVSWTPPIIGIEPFIYSINLIPIPSGNILTKSTSNLTTTFTTAEIAAANPSIFEYYVTVTASNSIGNGPITYYSSGGGPTPIILLPTYWATRISGTDTPTSVVDSLNNTIIIFRNVASSTTIYNSNNTTFEIIPRPADVNRVSVLKYDSFGLAKWFAKLESSGNLTINSVTTDSNNNIITTGTFPNNPTTTPPQFLTIYNSNNTLFGTITGDSDITPYVYIVKYDINGNGLWSTKIKGFSTPKSIISDSNNNIITTGSFSTSFTIYNLNNTVFKTLNPIASNDCYIIKYDINGNPLWATSLGSSSADQGNSLFIDSNNNIIVTGLYRGTLNIYNADTTSFGSLTNTGTNEDALIVKYNSNGFGVWATKIAGSLSADSDIGNSITIDSNDNIIVTGRYGNNSTTVYNATNLVIQPTFFGTLENIGLIDCFVVKYNSSGQAQWATRIAGTSNDIGNSINIDSNNNILVTGQYSSNPLTIYNATNLVTQPIPFGTLTKIGSTAAFIVKYNTSGQAQWATRIDGSIVRGFSISVDSNNNIISTGDYTNANAIIYNSNGILSGIELPIEGSCSYIVKYDNNGYIN